MTENSTDILVSIAVAIYNVEKFADKCIQSIVNQSYQKIEIILVDDGSTDRSGGICDNWARKDDRIKVIHKKNGGLSSARNAGLDAATGVYISFVDGDDWLSSDYVEYLLDITCKTNADMSMSLNIFTTRDQSQVFEDNIEVWTPERTATELLYPRIPIGAWNKIYNTNFIKQTGVRFRQPNFGEGLLFIVTVSQKAKSLGVGRRKVYNYRLNNTRSATTKPNVQAGINGRVNIQTIEDELIIRTPKLTNAVRWHKWKNDSLLIEWIIITNSIAEHKELYTECRNRIKRDTFNVLLTAEVSAKVKLKMLLVFLMPFFLARLSNYISNRRLMHDNTE